PAPAPRNARLFDDGCRGSAPPHKTTASRGRRAAFAPVQHGALARFASAKGLSSSRSLHPSSPVRSLAAIVPSYHSSFSEPQTRNPPTTNPFHERKFHGIDRLVCGDCHATLYDPCCRSNDLLQRLRYICADFHSNCHAAP